MDRTSLRHLPRQSPTPPCKLFIYCNDNFGRADPHGRSPQEASSGLRPSHLQKPLAPLTPFHHPPFPPAHHRQAAINARRRRRSLAVISVIYLKRLTLRRFCIDLSSGIGGFDSSNTSHVHRNPPVLLPTLRNHIELQELGLQIN